MTATTSPVMDGPIPMPVKPRKRRSALTLALIAAGVSLVLGSLVGVLIDRLTDPTMTITIPQAQQTVETVLQNDYGLADASTTTCQRPQEKAGTTFTCTAKTGAVESGTITVTVTVLNNAAQLSVGAPE